MLISHPPHAIRRIAQQGRIRELESEIAQLEAKRDRQLSAIQRDSGTKAERVAELAHTLSEVGAKQRLSYLLPRVNERAADSLLSDGASQADFLAKRECDAFVMSVDIRRSTELMLKAKTPEHFAEFITSLCSDLIQNITDSQGVFDKFTGDGILAFFPTALSGTGAGTQAVNAAAKCHETFERHYRQARQSFSAVLIDVGLGIGIDYGNVHLLQFGDGLTIVGSPVVYACRLSDCPAGMTYLNQPAFERVSACSANALRFSEVTIEIKHEGKLLAYDVQPSGLPSAPVRSDGFGTQQDESGSLLHASSEPHPHMAISAPHSRPRRGASKISARKG
jgi:class 3 adenylate cyclase